MAKRIQLPRASRLSYDKKLQSWLLENIDHISVKNGKPYFFLGHISHFSCQLPSQDSMNPAEQDAYFRNVIDMDMFDELKSNGVLNWSRSIIHLFPIAVPRDGNCLLHSAAFAVWGENDHKHILRSLLLRTLENDKAPSYKARWMHQRENEFNFQNPQSQNLEMIEQEWEDVINRVRSYRSQNWSCAVPYPFLESVHIYVVANILQRPIIIVSNPSARTLRGLSLQENTIHGIYLPLEWEPIECCKTPLILAYSFQCSHFCPLLSKSHQNDPKSPMLFPLVTQDLVQLPVRFLNKQEEPLVWKLLQDYLIIKDVTLSDPKGQTQNVPCSVLKANPLTQNPLELHFQEFIQQHRNLGKVNQLSPVKQNTSSYSSSQHGSQAFNIPVHSTKHTVQTHQESKGVGKQSGMPASPVSSGNSELELNLLPTAPLPSDDFESSNKMYSMMTQRCKNQGCGYRCSKTTYPYCHECYNLKNVTNRTSTNMSQSPELKNQSVSSKKPTSDPSLNMAELKAPIQPNLDWETKALPEVTWELPFDDEIVTSREPSVAEENQQILLSTCVGPDCTSPVFPPQTLCASCQRILMQERTKATSKKQVLDENRFSNTSRKEAILSPTKNKSYKPEIFMPRAYPVDTTLIPFPGSIELAETPYKVISQENAGAENQISHAKSSRPFEVPTSLWNKSSIATSLSRAKDTEAFPFYPPDNISPSFSSKVTYESSSPNTSLEKNVRDILVQMETKADRKKCRAEECKNFANPKKNGYCNACYMVYELQEEELIRSQWADDVVDFEKGVSALDNSSTILLDDALPIE